MGCTFFRLCDLDRLILRLFLLTAPGLQNQLFGLSKAEYSAVFSENTWNIAINLEIFRIIGLCRYLLNVTDFAKYVRI